MDNDLKCVFRATIPDIYSGMKMSADEMRIQFSVPASDMLEAMKLQLLRDKVFKVTVELDLEA